MPSTLPYDQARDAARQALQDSELGPAQRALSLAGVSDDDAFALISAVSEAPESVEPLRALAARLTSAHGAFDPGSLERVLLLRAMTVSLPRLPDMPLDPSVKRLFCDEVHVVITGHRGGFRYALHRGLFVALAKTATLRRFPAGQMHWEVSGIPRGWLARVRPPDMPRVFTHVAFRLGGLGPIFLPHLNANRRDRAALLERETNRSWYRMAASMKLQPRIRGLAASSWLHSPDTMAATPHMTAFSRTLIENGALVIRHHAADPDCGVFHRSPERRKLFDEGKFTPTHGLVIWPRQAMLAWADAHPELADG